MVLFPKAFWVGAKRDKKGTSVEKEKKVPITKLNSCNLSFFKNSNAKMFFPNQVRLVSEINNRMTFM